MRENSKDSTIERNYIRGWQHLCREYELVKARKHPKFRFVTDFYRHHKTYRQVFLKYYHRYKASGDGRDLLPQRRGPKPVATEGENRERRVHESQLCPNCAQLAPEVHTLLSSSPGSISK